MAIPYVDLDEAIEKEEGMSVSEIFKHKGEDKFRQLESEILRKQVAALTLNHNVSDLSGMSSRVVGLIACGGGTPCFHDNMKWMNEHGLTIWINPSAEVLKARLRKEKVSRPLIAGLTDEECDGFVESQLKFREKYYSMSKIQITSPQIPLQEIIKKIQDA